MSGLGLLGMATLSPADFPTDYLDQYNGGELLGTSITFMIITCALVGLRFYARISFRNVKLGLDDYLTLPALLANIMVQIACIGKAFLL